MPGFSDPIFPYRQSFIASSRYQSAMRAESRGLNGPRLLPVHPATPDKRRADTSAEPVRKRGQARRQWTLAALCAGGIPAFDHRRLRGDRRRGEHAQGSN
jgi:hypothetical protein